MARSTSWRDAAETLRRDLDGVVGTRLQALVVYEAHGLLGDVPGTSAATGDADIRHEDLIHTLALVDTLSPSDLARLAGLSDAWEKRGLAIPLFLSARDLARSLDAFPLEFSQILARHVVVFGERPFEGLSVDREDLRRACETQAKSHLLHLREGYLQTGGDARKVTELVAVSAVPIRALLVNIARLHGVNARSPEALLHFLEGRLSLATDGLRPIVMLGTRSSGFKGPDLADAFPAYLGAVEALARLVDEWTL
jgi:hypothetical protein